MITKIFNLVDNEKSYLNRRRNGPRRSGRFGRKLELKRKNFKIYSLKVSLAIVRMALCSQSFFLVQHHHLLLFIHMIVKPVKNFFQKNVTKVWLKPPPHDTFIEPWFPYALILKPIGRAFQRLGVYTYNNFIARTTFGLYPREWNPRVHGPYVHYRYYGTNNDIPLMEVKVNDLAAYIARRDKSPRAIWREFMRNFYKLQYFYFSGPEFGNPLTMIWRYLVIFIVGFFLTLRVVTGADTRFRHALYHW